MIAKLWEGDLPVCEFCQGGDHDACPDLMHVPCYELLCCGCKDPCHEGLP